MCQIFPNESYEYGSEVPFCEGYYDDITVNGKPNHLINETPSKYIKQMINVPPEELKIRKT